MWVFVYKCAVLIRQSCSSVKMFIHSFLHSVYWSPPFQFIFVLAIYSKAFQRPNQKLWTSSRETGPKHPEEPFCLTFIHSCSFSRVPPKSIWQTLVIKKKTLREEKQQVVLEPPTPHLLWYYLLLLSTDYVRWYDFYSLVWWSLWLLLLVFCCLWSTVIWDSEGGKNPPPCASNRPFSTLLMACQFPLPFYFLSN